MQRGVVIVAVILLVTASLAVGALAAHWPFWRRAWAWHEAQAGWPADLAGPRALLRGGAAPRTLAPPTEEIAAVAATARTQHLLRHRDGITEGWSSPGTGAGSLLDGRGLSVLVLPLLFDALERRHPGLLDKPVGAWLGAWKQDQRGAITPRELLARIAGGIGERPQFPALNPFASTAQLASGPDFALAALAVFRPAAPDVPGMLPAAAAQLLASVVEAVEGEKFATVLERELWSPYAAGDATLLLDHRRGAAAAHCCLEASAPDWLQLGLLLASAGDSGGSSRTWSTAGRTLVISADGTAAAFWAGEGAPPSGLEILVAAP
ncbi:MAG TPA: hypothetical protein VNQ32_08150 [Steroidobacteraceae bacterium]|nr:hypothetical protein [Steroidobacteraceae bacterium]